MAVDWEANVLIPCTAVFGENEPSAYFPADGSPSFDVVPVFDEAYREVIVLDVSAPTSDAMPVVGINSLQFLGHPEPKQNDKIRIPAPIWAANSPGWPRSYIVKEVRPDGHGNIKLMLTSTAAIP